MSSIRGKILVTGATGLIGKAIVSRLYDINKDVGNIEIYAQVRNEDKARRLFSQKKGVKFLVCDIAEVDLVNLGIDYVIHCASVTDSKSFVNSPVETIMTAIEGTKRILEFSRINHVKSLVYLSSMEVYGTPVTDEKIDEKHGTNIDTSCARSSYPESKRMCETLCTAYYNEFEVPVKTLRLTQTFGPGVNYNDGRVFAEFARCAIEEKNIVLNTKGTTKRNYLYIDDAVNAILTVLLYGDNGEIYNVANEETYCSIYQMAELVAKNCCEKEINVIINEGDNVDRGYAPTLNMNLDTSKIRALGWCPKVGLKEMYLKMIADMRNQVRNSYGDKENY